MDIKTISKQAKKAIAIGLCASLVGGGGLAVPVLSASNVAHAAEMNFRASASNSSVIQFKDENLKNAILSEMKGQNLIDQAAVDITEDDALKLAGRLDMRKRDITSIEGIESFKNITELWLGYNNISVLPPLSGMSKLSYLDLDHNHISDFKSLTNLTNLEMLSLDDNNISVLPPLSGMSELSYLSLKDNHISDLTPLLGTSKLRLLYLGNNQISDIKPLINSANTFAVLDLTNCNISDITFLTKYKDLSELHLSNNHISDLTPLAGLSKLEWLESNDQTITLRPKSSRVDLTKEIKGTGNVKFSTYSYIVNGVLIYRDYVENLCTIHAWEGGKYSKTNNYSATIYIDFSQAKKETTIRFEDENLKNAILSEMKSQNLIDQSVQDITDNDALKVTELGLSNNQITSIEGLNFFKNLTAINLDHNHISDLTPLSGLSKLATFSAQDQTITLQPKTIKVNLAKAIEGFGNVSFAPDKNIVNGVLTYKEGMGDTYTVSAHDGAKYSATVNIDFSKADKTPVIRFKDPVFKKSILSCMKEYKIISSDKQDITEADALKAERLNLSTSSNETITSLEGLEKFKNLSDLDISDSQISDITPLANLANLTRLKLCYNNGQAYNLSPIAGLTKLTDLKLCGGCISDITPLTNLTNLTDLNLDENQISDIMPLKGLFALEKLSIRENNISDFTSLKGLIALKELSLRQNGISNLTALKDLTNLTNLDLCHCRISDVTPLKDLTKLTSLNLSENQIQNLECLNTLNAAIDADLQTIKLLPTTTTVDLAKEIKGFGNVSFAPDENIVDGVLTYKEGMNGQYQASEKNGKRSYSATIDVDFSNANKGTESQTENISEKLQKLLDEYDAIKKTDNYKNADDNLKQAYDAAITDGQKIYDKLSSTPEQVHQAAERIKAALGKLNGDAKASASTSQLQNRIQQLEQELNKTKQQGTADKATIERINGELQQAKQQLEQLKQDKTKSDSEKQAEIDKLNGQITNLGKQIEQLKKDKNSLQDQLDVANGKIQTFSGELEKAKQQGTADKATIQSLTEQLQQTKNALEKLKEDQILSEQQKQAEIDKLNGQIADLGKQIEGLTKDKNNLQSQLNDANGKIQTLSGELEKAKQQGTADKAAIERLTGELQQAKNALEQLKSDKTKSDEQKQKEIDKLNSKIADLEKRITQLTKDKQSLQSRIEQLNKRIEELNTKVNTCSASDSEKAKELEKVKGELKQAKQQLDKLKEDKTKSDEEKQKEITKLNGQIEELNKRVEQLTKEKTDKEQELSNSQDKIKELEKQIESFKTNDVNKTKELDKIKQELKELAKTALFDKDKKRKTAELDDEIRDLIKRADAVTKENTDSQDETYKDAKAPVNNVRSTTLPKTGAAGIPSLVQLAVTALAALSASCLACMRRRK